MKKNRSFTLMELLVVIAVIALLAVIIYVLSQEFRRRSQDTSIETYLHDIRALAQTYIIDKEDYQNLCDDEEIKEIIGEIEKITSVNCFADTPDSYCIEAEAMSKEGEYCLDSTGRLSMGKCIDEETLCDFSN